jgi:hypothetical protein
MAETRVIITAQADQAIQEFERLRTSATGSLQQTGAGAAQLDRVRVSAAQTAAALRQVPAQFTDIVTSLQAGQAPLTVFLQQGGQLRDMFGSTGAAARALGGYVMGLINPYTVAAAAAVALGLAYQQGREEADAYRKAIVLTGNAAGVTTSQLADMAKQAAKSSGTVGQNAAVIAQLVSTGRVAADQLQRFSAGAIQSQKLLGISVEDTVKAYAELGKDPLQATVKLDEQYRYLTLTTYQQIKALTEQGRATEAAKTAQNAYAEAQDANNKKISQSLGYLEKTWNAVSLGAKKAWDAMLDVGREDTIDEKIKAAEQALKKAQLARFAYTGGTAAEKDAAVEEKQRLLDRLQNMKKVEDITAQYAAEDRKRFEAAEKFDQEGEKFLERKAKMEREIGAARVLGQQAAQRGEDPAETEERIQKRISDIRKSYADIYNDSIDAQIQAMKGAGAVEEEVAKRSSMALASARTAGLATSLAAEFEYAEKIERLDQDAFAREKARLQQELELTAKKPNSQKDQAALRDQITLLDAQALTRKLKLKQDIFELDVKDTKQAAANLASLADARSADLNSLNQQLQAQKDSNTLIGLSKEQVNAYNRKLVEESATRLENQAAIIGNDNARKAEAETMRASAAAMRSLAEAQAEGVIKSAQFEQQKKMWESIDQTAHDTFVSIFDSGKSAFDRLRDTLKNGLLDLLYQMTIKQWVFNIGAQVSGSSAIGDLGKTSGASSVLGAFSSASSLYSAGKTIFTGFNSGITGTIGSIATTFGNSIGSAAASAWGTGLTLTSTQAAEAAAAYTSAAASASAAGQSAAASTYASTAGGLTGGAGAAGAIPVIGWIIAGMAAADGFRKQGFDPNNGTTNTLGKIAAPLPLFTNKALQSLGVSASLANILSGASLNTKLFGRANPVVERQGLQGTITAGGVDAQNYADILEKGGIFRSDKRYVKTAAIDQGTDATFDSTVQAIAATIKEFGKSLGVEAGQIDAYSKSFKVELTSDDVKNQELVAKLFGDFGDELATNLVPNLGALAVKGETASTTLQRVTGDFLVVQGALDTLGVTSQQAFGAIGVASLAAREQLLKFAGGTDALASQVSYFTQNFLTATEQLAPVQKQVNEQLATLGYSQLKTVDDYKKAVLDLTSSGQLASEGGAKTYAALLALAPAFKAVTDAANDAQRDMVAQRADLQKELDGLTKTSLQLLAEQRAALDASNQSLFDQVQAAKAAKAAQDAAKTALQGVTDRTAAFAASMTKLRSDLLGGDLSILNPMDKYQQARLEYDKDLALARGGDADAQDKLGGLATAFLNASKLVNASSSGYTSDFIKVQNDSAEALKWASEQVDLGKATLDAYNKSIGVLTDINAGVATVADAIRALADAGGFVKIAGSHEGGLTRVPYDGYPMVAHQDEAVIDAPAMAAMRRYFGRAPSTGGGNQDALVAEMKALRAEVAALRKERVQGLVASIQANADAHKRTADMINQGTKAASTGETWQKQSRKAATV